jgi:hypothetical protein
MVGGLSKQIERMSGASSPSASKLSDMIAQRAFIQGRIDTLQQEIEDVTLQTTSVRVVKPSDRSRSDRDACGEASVALALASG